MEKILETIFLTSPSIFVTFPWKCQIFDILSFFFRKFHFKLRVGAKTLSRTTLVMVYIASLGETFLYWNNDFYCTEYHSAE